MRAPGQSQKGASRARDAITRHEVLASGILSGVAGGAAMLAVLIIGATSQGLAAAYPLQVIGESFVGSEALAGAARIAFGAFVLLATSAMLGVLLAALIPPDYETPSALVVGLGFALFTLMFAMPLILPWANPGFRAGMQPIGGTWVIAIALFGVTLGMRPALLRRLSRGATAEPAMGAERVRPRVRPVARKARTM